MGIWLIGIPLGLWNSHKIIQGISRIGLSTICINQCRSACMHFRPCSQLPSPNGPPDMQDNGERESNIILMVLYAHRAQVFLLNCVRKQHARARGIRGKDRHGCRNQPATE